MDPASTLGLSTESVHGYSISHVKRVLDTEPPELPPCRRGVTSIAVVLKGQYWAGRAGTPWRQGLALALWGTVSPVLPTPSASGATAKDLGKGGGHWAGALGPISSPTAFPQ